MGAFFADVAATKALLARIGRALRSLNAMHAESKAATRVDDMRELREKMQAETEATTKVRLQACGWGGVGERVTRSRCCWPGACSHAVAGFPRTSSFARARTGRPRGQDPPGGALQV